MDYAAKFGCVCDGVRECFSCFQKAETTLTLTQIELDKLLSEAYADGRSDQLEEMKEKTT